VTRYCILRLYRYVSVQLYPSVSICWGSVYNVGDDTGNSSTTIDDTVAHAHQRGVKDSHVTLLYMAGIKTNGVGHMKIPGRHCGSRHCQLGPVA